MLLRRSAAVLAASVLLSTVPAALALADETPAPSPSSPAKLPDGLYGTGDPQYDGVWRQSLALLAQRTAGVTPSARAVDWLAGQQCADGSFAAYRADAAAACDSKTVADVNATAAAVQALTATGGHDQAVDRSVAWLKSVQNKDGSWGYNPGSPGDANSLAVVIGALAAAGEDPAKTLPKGGKSSPYDALTGFQLGCGTAADKGRGAFAYQPDAESEKLLPNDAATVAAVLAAYGEGLAVDPVKKDADVPVKPPRCDDSGGDGGPERRDPAAAGVSGAAYLVRTLEANGQHLMSVLPGSEDQPDYANTALATLALAAGGHRTAAEKPLNWLEQNAGQWDKSQDDPAALACLILAAHAAGGDPADFGGIDLVDRLNATGPDPQVTAGAADTEHQADGENAAGDGGDDSGSGFGVWWFIGIGLAVGAGIGLLLSMRNKRRNA